MDKQTDIQTTATPLNFLVDSEGYYGEFGGAYIPEILHQCVGICFPSTSVPVAPRSMAPLTSSARWSATE